MINELELACKDEKNLAERIAGVFCKFKTTACQEKISAELYAKLKSALQHYSDIDIGFAATLKSSGAEGQTMAQSYGTLFLYIPELVLKTLIPAKNQTASNQQVSKLLLSGF